jgi:hypothetical protein
MLKLASERDYAVEKLAKYEQQMAVEKVATAMIQKGITTEPFSRVYADMMKIAEDGKLNVVSAALDMHGPDMGEKVARLADTEGSYVGAGASDLETFLLSGS